MPADFNFGKRSRMRSRKNIPTSLKSDQSGSVSAKLESIPKDPFNNEDGSLEERELSELQDQCQCCYDKPKCSNACEQAKKLKYPDTCAKSIGRLHALLHASARDLQAIRIENSELRQLLASQKKANALLQEQENQRLSSELEISRGKLNTMTTAWDHCFRRLLDENKKLQVNVANLQKTIKELQNKEKSDCSKCQNEESVEVASRAYSEEPNCGCSHAQQVRRLKEKVKELRIREANQHNRANDFEISLDAYKIALEKQFSENQTFIRKLSKVLEASHTNPEASDKPTETNDLSSCNDLTQWIEKALKSALEENGERIRKLSGGSRMSLNLESSYPTPSSSFSTRRHSFANSIQYSKRPVNGRSKSRKVSLRLQTLTRAMETLNSSSTNKIKAVSPLETLLLMVNEILEKLTEGRMEEYIHTERQKLLQDKNNRQFQILMTTTTA